MTGQKNSALGDGGDQGAPVHSLSVQANPLKTKGPETVSLRDEISALVRKAILGASTSKSFHERLHENSELEEETTSAILSLLPPKGWRPIESAPKEPIRANAINDFLPTRLGPLLLMQIPFRPHPAVTVGFWSPDGGCWRHLADDGPHDIEPTHWQPLPDPPPAAPVTKTE